MPRKNNQIPHTPYSPVDNEAGKRRFSTQREAEQAAQYQMLLQPDLELYVYRSELDKGWYLTRKKSEK